MEIAAIARRRHAAKAFDPGRPLTPEQVEHVRELLRNSASSVNSQPWHFVLAQTEAGKANIAQAAHGPFAYNAPKIRDAGLVVVFCARTDMDAGHLNSILEQEQRDGRHAGAAEAEAARESRASFVDIHRFEKKDVQHWMEKQVFLALGTLLLGAAAMGLDACPMEGFYSPEMEAALGLRQRNLTVVALVALGYRCAQDWNAALPKSRLPATEIFTEI